MHEHALTHYRHKARSVTLAAGKLSFLPNYTEINVLREEEELEQGSTWQSDNIWESNCYSNSSIYKSIYNICIAESVPIARATFKFIVST